MLRQTKIVPGVILFAEAINGELHLLFLTGLPIAPVSIILLLLPFLLALPHAREDMNALKMILHLMSSRFWR